MPIQTKHTAKKRQRRTRPSQIRLSGVPPIMPIKTHNQQKNKRQNRPSEIRLPGVPPIMAKKTQNRQKKPCSNEHTNVLPKTTL